MLKSPRRLPTRFNRPVSPQMRQLVAKRHQRQAQHRKMRWQRMIQRMQRRVGSMRKVIMQFAALTVTGLLILLISLSLFSPILFVREVRVSRSDARIDAERVQGALAPLFGQHLFFLQTQQVEEILEAAVPDLADARVTKQYPSTLHIRLTLDPIIATLTIDDPDRTPTGTGAVQTATGQIIPDGADFLTSEGMYAVYQPSQIASGSNLLELRIVDWGVRPEPWKRLIDPAFLEHVQQAETLLGSDFGVTVTSRSVYARAREFHLQTPSYALWFDTRSPLEEQLQRYSLFLASNPPGGAKQYIDLRLKEKIVYE